MGLSVKDFTLSMVAITPLPASRSKVLVSFFAFLCLVGLSFLPALTAQAAVIVLDPGHGGNDSGAGRGSAFAEKQFSLALAQKIAALLAARHQVELTRTSDIQLTPADRAGVANHLRADLMISLHAGDASYCSDRTAAVYYHNDERLEIPFGNSFQGNSAESEADRPAWVRLQMQHQHQSQSLAATLKRSLVDSQPFDRVTVSGVPLAPLMGADLPAVLVEVGCVLPTAASSAQALKLLMDGYAASIADAIETAIGELVQ
jgi:N-acetylmuramoyl-L-alanine amidase